MGQDVGLAARSINLKGVRVEKRAVAAGVITLDLPYPPSTNNLFYNVQGRGRIISKEYAAWKNEAGGELLIQRPRCAVGPVRVTITVEERSKSADIDNRIKACLDLLVQHGIIADDNSKTVRAVTAQWGDVAGAHVEIFPAGRPT